MKNGMCSLFSKEITIGASVVLFGFCLYQASISCGWTRDHSSILGAAMPSAMPQKSLQFASVGTPVACGPILNEAEELVDNMVANLEDNGANEIQNDVQNLGNIVQNEVENSLDNLDNYLQNLVNDSENDVENEVDNIIDNIFPNWMDSNPNGG